MGLNRREFVQASLAGAASLGVWGTFSEAYAQKSYDPYDSRSYRGYDYGYDEMQERSEGRKGYALCLAADRTGYGAPPLRSAEKDARDMAAILHRAGFQVRLWTGRNATTRRIGDDLKRARDLLRSGDVLYYTWAGHGTHQRDSQGDEQDGEDEMWCTYDRPLIDDEQLAAFSQFEPGVRIRMISDCCHSGSQARMLDMVRAMELDQARSMQGAGTRSMAVSSREIEEAAEYVRDLDDGEVSGYATFRGIPDPMREAWENNPNNQRTMARVKERNADGRDERGVRASVLSLGACRDRQVSLDGAQNGLFTENLKARLSAGFRGSLQELGVEIARFTSRQGQDPTYDNFGEHNGSERERIFTI